MTNNSAIFKELTIISFSLFIIHLLLFNLPFFIDKVVDFYYSVPILYVLFYVLSSIVLLIVSKISEKNFDNTGMVFMIATSIKMVIAYFFVRPILQFHDNKIEKINFFAIFIVFLITETIIVAKMLNKK
jgi:hypothetical protein